MFLYYSGLNHIIIIHFNASISRGNLLSFRLLKGVSSRKLYYSQLFLYDYWFQ